MEVGEREGIRQRKDIWEGEKNFEVIPPHLEVVDEYGLNTDSHVLQRIYDRFSITLWVVAGGKKS